MARFTYAPGYIDAVAVHERDLNSDQDFVDANEVVYYHSNTLYSIYALSNSAGSAIERYRYDAYGASTVLDADGSDDADGLSDVQNPYVFTGRRLEPETALLQYRNRSHSVTLGRFISRDPLEYEDAFNLFAYVGCRPTVSVDPHGLVDFVPTKCSCVRRKYGTKKRCIKAAKAWKKDCYETAKWLKDRCYRGARKVYDGCMEGCAIIPCQDLREACELGCDAAYGTMKVTCFIGYLGEKAACVVDYGWFRAQCRVCFGGKDHDKKGN